VPGGAQIGAVIGTTLHWLIYITKVPVKSSTCDLNFNCGSFVVESVDVTVTRNWFPW